MARSVKVATSFTPIGFHSLHWDGAIWMRYRQGCWLLRHLLAQDVCNARDAEIARLEIAQRLGWDYAMDEHPWDGPPEVQVPVNVRHYFGMLVCETCGNPYGRKSWHPNSAHHHFVFECPINYRKRGSCATPHIYQE